MSDDEKPQVFGYVLILRGLAAAAIQLKDYPAALRVLCVAAEYMNKNGHCRVSACTIAARLGISRQAVGKHLKLLETFDIIGTFTEPGKAPTIGLNTDYETKRHMEGRVGVQREWRRRRKHGEVRSDDRVPGRRYELTHDGEGREPDWYREVQPNEVAGGATLKVASGATR